jgi:hypothetical protein
LQIVLLTADQRLFCYVERTIFARPMGLAVGLTSGESLVGIDFRPANGILYGLGNQGGVYTLVENPAMGNVTATRISTLTNAVGGAVVTLSGTAFGVDFNPVPDRLRVISDTGQNLRINVETGVTNVDGALTPATGFVAAGYTNNDADATTNTVLYTVNSTATDQLNIQSPPNNGNQAVVGNIGFDSGASLAIDIFTVVQAPFGGGPAVTLRNRAIALLNTAAGSNIYQVNLDTGAATLLQIPGGAAFQVPLLGLAIPLVQSGTIVF